MITVCFTTSSGAVNQDLDIRAFLGESLHYFPNPSGPKDSKELPYHLVGRTEKNLDILKNGHFDIIVGHFSGSIHYDDAMEFISKSNGIYPNAEGLAIAIPMISKFLNRKDQRKTHESQAFGNGKPVFGLDKESMLRKSGKSILIPFSWPKKNETSPLPFGQAVVQKDGLVRTSGGYIVYFR